MFGSFDVQRIMAAHKARESRRWAIRIDNALWCYRVSKNQEEKQDVLQTYREEFLRLGWRVKQAQTGC
jgi:hypothetical protein